MILGSMGFEAHRNTALVKSPGTLLAQLCVITLPDLKLGAKKFSTDVRPHTLQLRINICQGIGSGLVEVLAFGSTLVLALAFAFALGGTASGSIRFTR